MTRASVQYVLAATLIFVVGMRAPVRVQTTDFSGTWMFDASKSVGTPPPPITGPGVRGGGGRGASLRVDPNRMVITQSPTAFSVNTNGVEFVFRLDGTETNVHPTPGYPKGKAAWENGKLVLTTKLEVYAGMEQGYITLDGKEVYSLNDGVLTIERTDTTRKGTTETRKLVYTKAPS